MGGVGCEERERELIDVTTNWVLLINISQMRVTISCSRPGGVQLHNQPGRTSLRPFVVDDGILPQDIRSFNLSHPHLHLPSKRTQAPVLDLIVLLFQIP